VVILRREIELHNTFLYKERANGLRYLRLNSRDNFCDQDKTSGVKTAI
jgi:hypothetical protein